MLPAHGVRRDDRGRSRCRPAGFAIGLPSSWVDITKAAPSVLEQLEKVPSFKAFAQAASQNGSLKLIAADPAGKGTVYMNVGAARLPGPYSVKQVASATAAQLKKTLGPKGSVSATPVKLAAGPAYRIHLSKKGSPNETDEYVLVKDQVEYVIVYVAPHTTWKQHEALFTSSARSFRFLPAPEPEQGRPRGRRRSGRATSSRPSRSARASSARRRSTSAPPPTRARAYASAGCRSATRRRASGVDVSNEIVTLHLRRRAAGARRGRSRRARLRQDARRADAGDGEGDLHGRAAQGSEAAGGRGRGEAHDHGQRRASSTSTQTGVAIYQVKGDTLSGVYAFVGKGTTYADAQRIAFHAAEQSAKNLGGGSTGFTA